ncbi:MAG: helix-turn-helix transcriptional regulator [Lachnospiraceae bacterium]|nr:helix-turn-helix transcriptional regulator [Lachnospiraceae bacterium]
MPRENLKKARQKAGMTQKQVAEYLGISERYYQHIEAGQRTGDFTLWDMLEDLFSIHQRKLRELEEHPLGKANYQGKHLK